MSFFLLSANYRENRENLRGELEFLHYLKENGYSSMVPIETKDGVDIPSLINQNG